MLTITSNSTHIKVQKSTRFGIANKRVGKNFSRLFVDLFFFFLFLPEVAPEVPPEVAREVAPEVAPERGVLLIYACMYAAK